MVVSENWVLTLARESCSVVSDSLRPHGLYSRGILQARILEWVAIASPGLTLGC